jgi:hypothetical protein
VVVATEGSMVVSMSTGKEKVVPTRVLQHMGKVKTHRSVRQRMRR